MKCLKRCRFFLILLFSVLLSGAGGGISESRALYQQTDYADSAEIDDENIICRSEIMYSKEEIQEPESVYIHESGRKYGLKSWHLETVTVEARKEEVKKTVRYEKVEDSNAIPSELVIVSENTTTGQSVKENYPVLNIKCEKEWWSDDFSFPAVFHQYEADYYQLGSDHVMHNDERPGLETFDIALLSEIGVNPENYRITDAKWNGEAYIDDQGVMCRNAIVSGQKKLADYQVTYGGTVEYPETFGTQRVAVYGTPESGLEQMRPAMDKPIDSIELYSEPYEQTPKYEIIQQTVIITLSLLLVVAVLLFLVWLLLKSLHKSKEKQKERLGDI